MKKIYLCLLLFSVSIYSFSQNEKWRQKNARINFVVAPQGEFLKIAGNYSPVASLSASIAFNETYFVGIYGSMKVLPTFSEYPIAPGVKYDAKFQHGGLEGVYSLKLGLYRTKGGHYVQRKMRVTFGLRAGLGLMWLNTETQKFATRSDYFANVQPSAGILWPINDFIKFNAGAYFSTVIKLNVLDQYFTPKDFMGPGVFAGLRFNVFR